MNDNSEYKFIIIGDKKLKFYCKPIGKGSFAKVFYAISVDDDITYAIKRIDISKLDVKILERLRFEMDVMKKLNHKNIVQCYDTFVTDRYIYLFMEYCNYGSLGDLIKTRNLDENDTKKIMIQMKDGLEYLRDMKIMHRDLKPTNILLHVEKTEDNVKNIDISKLIIKIADFGFAKYFNPDEDLNLNNTMCGTPLYMAPEIVCLGKYNSKSDLWSIGVIIYEMIYKKVPYTATSIAELFKKINKYQVYYDPRIGISDECKELISGLLKVNPIERLDWNEMLNNSWVNENKEKQEEQKEQKCESIFEMDDVSDSLLDTFKDSLTDISDIDLRSSNSSLLLGSGNINTSINMEEYRNITSSAIAIPSKNSRGLKNDVKRSAFSLDSHIKHNYLSDKKEKINIGISKIKLIDDYYITEEKEDIEITEDNEFIVLKQTDNRNIRFENTGQTGSFTDNLIDYLSSSYNYLKKITKKSI
jgi:serine/threonine-protein kinase ULK/ATG1